MRKPSRKRGHTHQLVEALHKHTVGISGKAARQYHSSNKFTYRSTSNCWIYHTPAKKTEPSSCTSPERDMSSAQWK